jgi:hypothetical protein
LLYSDIGFGVAFANVCIILVLLSIYWQNYRKWKSQYTIGLLVFGIFLLIQNILSLGFLGPPSPPPGPPMANPIDLPLLLINISQLVALATLLRISYK